MRTHLNPRARDGFALPMALLAMVVIGAIVTGGFYVASQEHDISISSDLGVQGMHVAEFGLENVIGSWTNATLQAAVAPITGGVWSEAGRQIGTYELSVQDMGSNLFMIQSESQVQWGARTATRRVATFVRTSQAQMPHNAAMTVFGQLAAAGNSTITGVDRCGGSMMPGIVAKEDSMITGMKHGQRDRIVGDPAVTEDAGMTQQTLSDFGDIDLAGFIQSATHVFTGNPAWPQLMAPATKTEFGQTVCDKSVPTNWGDPGTTGQPCSNYYPIIYSDGNLKMDVGRGQGVLVVGGDLLIDGNVEFDGIVIVTGSFTMKGTGSKINGTVIVQGDGEIDTLNIQEGNAQVQWDACTVANALNANLRVRPLVSRSWVMDTPPLASMGG